MKNEKGYVLVYVILVFTLLSILTMGIMATANGNMKLGYEERRFQSSYYIAEAGLTYHVFDLKEEIFNAYKDADTQAEFFARFNDLLDDYEHNPRFLDEFEKTYGQDPKSYLSLEKSPAVTDADGNISVLLTAKSRGNIDTTSRLATMSFTVTWKDKESHVINANMAVYSENGINIDGGGPNLNGPIGTKGDVNVNGDLKGITEIYVNDGNEEKLKTPGFEWWMDANKGKLAPLVEQEFPMPPFPDIPDNYSQVSNHTIESVDGHGHKSEVIKDGKLIADHWLIERSENFPDTGGIFTVKLIENTYFKQIEISEGKKMAIDVGDKDISIVVDKLNLGGYLEIVGTGKLTVYIKDVFTLGNNGNFNSKGKDGNNWLYNKDDVEKLNIYYAGTNKITTHAANLIAGSMYVKDANMSIGNGSGVKGHLFVGGNNNIELSGGTNTGKGVLYAPGSNVKMNAGAVLTGSVVASEFTASGGGTINFTNDDLPENPFEKTPASIEQIIPSESAIREG